MFDFTGKVVMVGGVSGNLGGAVTRAFADVGAHLVLIDRSTDRLSKLFPDLAASGDHLLLGQVDASDPVSVRRAVKMAIQRFGHVDVLANSIGGYRAGTPVQDTPLSTWDFMFNLNARTAFIISQEMVPQMLKQGHGRIIHTAARAAEGGSANAAAYAASKTAVLRLVESLAAELKQTGITVNAVLPGTIDTPQNRDAMPKADHSRWVPPEAIADVFLFLASDLSRAVSGAAIPVYGRS